MRLSPVTCSLLLGALTFACTPKPEAKVAQDSPATKQVSGERAQALVTGAVVDGETYQIMLPQAKGEALKVLPKVGYKVNKDFPHRLMLKSESPEGISVTGAHTEQELSFALTEGLTCASGRCEGSADFSICNDQMCKLYRGVSVAWGAK